MKQIAQIIFLFVFIFYGVLPILPTSSTKHGHLGHTIYITSNEIHTAFLFPKNEASDFLEFLPIDQFKIKNFEGVEFSFGDKDFFTEVPTWDKLTLGVLLDSLFTAEPGLIHVDLLREIPHNSKTIIRMEIDDSQYKKLVVFILDSFKTHNKKPIIYKDYNYYGSDRFFLSPIQFHLFYTCNSWIGEALRYSGIKTGITTPHKWGILFHLK